MQYLEQTQAEERVEKYLNDLEDVINSYIKDCRRRDYGNTTYENNTFSKGFS